jgi:alpha-amylase
MRNLCLYFQVHQPFRLRQYRFFDIGHHDNYFDEHYNAFILNKVAEKCYRPANRLLLELIRNSGGRFKVSFSISGTALDQFEAYAPDVLESFKELAATGQVEFLAETSAHSLVALKCEKEFRRQVTEHALRIEKLFGQRPVVLRNTELIYSDQIGLMAHKLGFKAVLTEGADHILDWQSPNYLYHHPTEPQLHLLLKNYKLSDDIAFRFSDPHWSEGPLTAEKFVHWLNAVPQKEQIINLFMDYETFGEHQWKESGIFEFLKALPQRIFDNSDYKFVTPSEAISELKPVAPLPVPCPISWADEARDLSAWLSNDLQRDAFESLYKLKDVIQYCDDERLIRKWSYLQTSDHFYYMCTKYFADGDVHKYFNHYDSPYEAYINYMNVLSDFEMRLRESEIKRTSSITPLLIDNLESLRMENNIKHQPNESRLLQHTPV